MKKVTEATLKSIIVAEFQKFQIPSSLESILEMAVDSKDGPMTTVR